MILKLYYDLRSQPSRSLYILLKLSKIPFEECPVDLGTGEHMAKDFAEAKSKIQKVPFIHDGNFKLNESVAIVRYLSRECPLAINWYPIDSKKQAKVDEYLEWHHLNIRLYCSTYFLVKWRIPLTTGQKPSEEKVKEAIDKMEKSLKDFERIFLSEDRFLFGDTISYADIHAACEIEQTRMAGYDARDYFPKIKTWLENVRAVCNPIYDDAHKIMNAIAAQAEKETKSELCRN